MCSDIMPYFSFDLLHSKVFFFLTLVLPETPSMSPVLVWFKDDAYHQLEPPNLEINWDPFNLTMNKDAKVNC